MRRKRGMPVMLAALTALVGLGAACVRDLDALQRLDGVADAPNAAVEAGSDGSRPTADVGAPRDAAVEVEAGSRPCGEGVFCATFDPPSDVSPFGFTSVIGAPAALTLGAGLSAPSALLLTAAPTDPPRGLEVELGTAKVIDYTWSLRLLQIGGTKASDAVAARLACGTNELEIKAKRSSKLQIQFNDSSSEIGVGSDWVEIRFSWDLAAGRGRLVVGGGAPIEVATNVGCAGSVRASLGWLDLGDTRDGTWEALFDDVRITTTN